MADESPSYTWQRQGPHDYDLIEHTGERPGATPRREIVGSAWHDGRTCWHAAFMGTWASGDTRAQAVHAAQQRHTRGEELCDAAHAALSHYLAASATTRHLEAQVDAALAGDPDAGDYTTIHGALVDAENAEIAACAAWERAERAVQEAQHGGR